MEVTEISETIAEPGHEHHHVTDETFRKRVGVFIGGLAMALAITGMGGSSAMKQVINANIERSDHFSYYQAKNIRESDTKLADDQLAALLATRPDLPAEAAQVIRAERERYAKDIDRLESDETKGDGKKQILARAKIAEAARDEAQERSENFEFAEAFLQIAVVVASTSILTASRPLLLVAAIFAVLGVLGSLNGFMLFAALPHF
ncbi:MAG: DUF4337 domain-containing protein [Aliidongia sp.]